MPRDVMVNVCAIWSVGTDEISAPQDMGELIEALVPLTRYILPPTVPVTFEYCGGGGVGVSYEIMTSSINLCAGTEIFAEDSNPVGPATKNIGCDSEAVEFHLFPIVSSNVSM